MKEYHEVNKQRTPRMSTSRSTNTCRTPLFGWMRNRRLQKKKKKHSPTAITCRCCLVPGSATRKRQWMPTSLVVAEASAGAV